MNKIYVIGIGPGSYDMMTGQAIAALQECDVIIGYTVYVDLLRDHFEGKEWMTTPMKKEIERCRLCFEQAMQGKTVAMVCSGDAGIYGMASPMATMAPEYPQVELQIIPGITAASSWAALLGAPMNHDFCVISLSDLLTPWETIERRLRAAIEGDFCIALYNPGSHKRNDYLQKACDIMLLSGADPERKCGIVRNIGREGQEAKTYTLSQLRETTPDMFSTVFIGNSKAEVIDGRVVTPRGYVI